MGVKFLNNSNIAFSFSGNKEGYKTFFTHDIEIDYYDIVFLDARKYGTIKEYKKKLYASFCSPEYTCFTVFRSCIEWTDGGIGGRAGAYSFAILIKNGFYYDVTEVLKALTEIENDYFKKYLKDYNNNQLQGGPSEVDEDYAKIVETFKQYNFNVRKGKQSYRVAANTKKHYLTYNDDNDLRTIFTDVAARRYHNLTKLIVIKKDLSGFVLKEDILPVKQGDYKTVSVKEYLPVEKPKEEVHCNLSDEKQKAVYAEIEKHTREGNVLQLKEREYIERDIDISPTDLRFIVRDFAKQNPKVKIQYELNLKLKEHDETLKSKEVKIKIGDDEKGRPITSDSAGLINDKIIVFGDPIFTIEGYKFKEQGKLRISDISNFKIKYLSITEHKEITHSLFFKLNVSNADEDLNDKNKITLQYGDNQEVSITADENGVFKPKIKVVGNYKLFSIKGYRFVADNGNKKPQISFEDERLSRFNMPEDITVESMNVKRSDAKDSEENDGKKNNPILNVWGKINPFRSNKDKGNKEEENNTDSNEENKTNVSEDSAKDKSKKRGRKEDEKTKKSRDIDSEKNIGSTIGKIAIGGLVAAAIAGASYFVTTKNNPFIKKNDFKAEIDKIIKSEEITNDSIRIEEIQKIVSSIEKDTTLKLDSVVAYGTEKIDSLKQLQIPEEYQEEALANFLKGFNFNSKECENFIEWHPDNAKLKDFKFVCEHVKKAGDIFYNGADMDTIESEVKYFHFIVGHEKISNRTPEPESYYLDTFIGDTASLKSKLEITDKDFSFLSEKQTDSLENYWYFLDYMRIKKVSGSLFDYLEKGHNKLKLTEQDNEYKKELEKLNKTLGIE